MIRVALLLAAAVVCLRTPCQAGGQWIAVVAPGLQDAVPPLVEQRRGEGWEVTVITAAADPAPAMRQIAALAAKSQPCCVVLVGEASETGVPAGRGTKLRMKGQPTDAAWSACAPDSVVETGRLPARSTEEAQVMVQKILTWPREQRTKMAFPSAALLGGHHGVPEPFGRSADFLGHAIYGRLFARLPAAWELDAAMHLDGSPWEITGSDMKTAPARMMSTRSTLLAYMGHSTAEGASSKVHLLLTGPDWKRLPATGPRPGLFFTCGCYSCQVSTERESFGLAAMRAPGGPPAVIGSHGESWAAMGYLAIQGLTTALASQPVRLGEFWRATRQGLEKGEISPAEFALMDMADGTRGKVPLDQQRAEHLEMWMLLGDPAMPLAPQPPGIKVEAALAETSLTFTGTLPAAATGSAVRLTVQRHPSAVPQNLPAAPAQGPNHQRVARERRRLASEVTFAAAEVTSDGTSFMAKIPIPAGAPPKPWTVRAGSTAGEFPASGVAVLK
jgi:hypothetical protein